MIPYKFKSLNGHDIKFISDGHEERVIARLYISTLGMDERIFTFTKITQLEQLYRALLIIYKTINSQDKCNVVRTIDLPYIKTNQYIAMFTNNEDACIMRISYKHIRDDEYTQADIIEIDKNSLYTLLTLLDRILYD